MGKLFAVNKNQASVITTLLVLIMLGAIYFFIYLPKNETTVQQRRFRCLQNIDTNIHSKIDNSNLLINNILLPDSITDKYSLDRLIDYKRKLKQYIAAYPNDNFTLLLSDRILRDRPGYINSKLFTLSISRVLKKTKDTLTIIMQYGFEKFIKRLLPAEVFDNYIVFINDKRNAKGNNIKEVYETFPSGLSIQVKDSLLQAKGGVTGPGLHNLNISGDDYKVFSQPVSIDENRELIVVGLVLNSNYQKEKNQLPLGIVLLLLTTAIVLIVSLPWIKLYHMGSKDKLTVTDGISSVLVSMLLMSLLFFVVFKYSIYFSSNYKHFSESKSALAYKVTRAFEGELDTVYKRLSKFDSIYNNLKKNHLDGITGIKYNDALKSYEKGIDIHQVFWLNKKGIVQNNWFTDIKITDSSDFSGRDYFKNIINNKPNKIDRPGFYLDQVVSRTSGVFISVLAKKSINDSTAVAALGFTAQSLDKVIMPDGYQFAVIDNKGKVLYHSRAERNLNENLTKELADSSNLVSCLYARSDTSFAAQYYGREYNIKITPFAHLPYFTVIFEDLEYNNARDTEPYVFTISMLLYLLVFMIFQIAVVFFVSSKRSFFKKQLFETSWIGPKTTSLKQYNQAIIGNCVIIILLVAFFRHSSFLEYVYILLFSITFVSVLLNSIFAISYRKQSVYNYRFKTIAVKWLGLFVAVIDYTAWLTLGHPDHSNFWHLIAFEGLSAGLCLGFYKADNYLETNARKLLLLASRKLKYNLFTSWNYTHSFSLMATTRLIITSGIPVAFLFIHSFNYEQSLDTRYRQLVFANALTQKITTDTVNQSKSATINNAGLDIISKGKLFNAGVYYDGIFIKDFQHYPNDQKRGAKGKTAHIWIYTKEDSITANIFSALRLYKNNIALKSNNMNFPSVDGDAFFNKLTLKHIDDNNTTRTYYKMGNGKYIFLKSGRIDYPPMLFRFWVLLFFAIIGFYYVIHNIIGKLFALNLPMDTRWETMDEKLLLDNKLNGLLFILGSPGSGKLKNLTKKIKLTEEQENELAKLAAEGKPELRQQKLNKYKIGKLLDDCGELLIFNKKDKSENNVFVADMIRISTVEGNDEDWKACKEEALSDKNVLVIINHFEYNIKDTKTNSIKLDFLENLMQKGKSKVIIISSVHPLTFLDSYNEQQKDPQPAGQQTNRIPESELERWHVLLGHFRIIINSLKNNPELHCTTALKHYIYNETAYSHFLNDMQQITLDAIPPVHEKNIDTVSDSLIFKLQITSHYFYTYIWQSLTKEEKFLLYDLAEDGLVNPYDDYNLSMLICKGLIIKPNGTLMLFSKGFRNFILTAIGTSEVKRLKKQVKDNGNWGSLKTPLSLAILAILVFLIASQQEAYTRVITYITALGAGVPAVLKLFSMVGNGDTQKTS